MRAPECVSIPPITHYSNTHSHTHADSDTHIKTYRQPHKRAAGSSATDGPGPVIPFEATPGSEHLQSLHKKT